MCKVYRAKQVFLRKLPLFYPWSMIRIKPSDISLILSAFFGIICVTFNQLYLLFKKCGVMSPVYI